MDGFVAEGKNSMEIYTGVYVGNDAKGKLVSSKTENTSSFPSLLSLPKRSRSLEEPTSQAPVLVVPEKKGDMMSSLSGGLPFLMVSRPSEKQSYEAFYFLLLLPTDEPRLKVDRNRGLHL